MESKAGDSKQVSKTLTDVFNRLKKKKRITLEIKSIKKDKIKLGNARVWQESFFFGSI